MTTTERVAPRLKQRYRDEIRDGLQEQFGYGNVMQIPGVVKVVVNMGVGERRPRREADRRRGSRPGHDHRPEAAGPPGDQVHRAVQAA